MKFDLGSVQVGAVFQIEKFKEDGTVTYRGPEFHNIVLDQALLWLANGTYALGHLSSFINLGSGSSDPAPTQTGLDARLYSTNVVFNSQRTAGVAHDPDYVYVRTTYQFNIGACTGTFREVGMSYSNNAEYFNRALLKDAQGNPTSITVAADEGLRIVGEIRLRSSLSARLCRYKLDLKGATGGSIVFTNGTTTKSITVATMIVQTALNTYCGIPRPATHCTSFVTTLDDIYGNEWIRSIFMQADGTFSICMMPYFTANPNLSIQSHTLTGGSGPPELTVTKAWEPNPTGSFNHVNETTSVTTTINYFFRQTERAITGNDVGAWGGYDVTGGPGSQNVANTYCMAFYALLRKPDGNTLPAWTSRTAVQNPVTGDLRRTLKFYWAPGKLGTGSFSFNAIHVDWHDYNNWASRAFIEFDKTITISDIEEYDITLTMTFARAAS